MATRMPIARCSSRRMYQRWGGSVLDPRPAAPGKSLGQVSQGFSVTATDRLLEVAARRDRAGYSPTKILAAARGEAAVAGERSCPGRRCRVARHAAAAVAADR